MLYKQCPAKINLFLKVLNKRADGYHNIYSAISKITLYDELSVELANDFSLNITGDFKNEININDNLFITIFNYFKQNFLINNNLKINIKKNIPVGAGLGGGSSNACQFMIILNDLFNLKLSVNDLKKISLNFGSDIAFFFEKSPQIVSSRGEELKAFSINDDYSILLIFPNINLSTKVIFEKYSPDISANNFLNFDYKLPQINFDEILNIANDLEKYAILQAPVISEIKQQLLLHNALYAKMTGSGSTVFGVFKNDKQLALALAKITEKYKNYFIKQVKLNYN